MTNNPEVFPATKLEPFHELFERSKDDRAMIVGSEVRLVIMEYRNALKAMKACHLQMLQSNNNSEYAQEANEMAIAVKEREKAVHEPK